MAYLGASAVLDNANTALDRTELANKIYQETLFAFDRNNVFLDRIYRKSIANGKSGQFIVGGKADGTRTADYTAGTQVDVTATPNSERTIVIGLPQYVAERIDQFEEKMAEFPTRSIITQNHGQDLSIKMDKAIASKIYDASQATGLVGNGDGITVTNTVINTGVTTKERGHALMEAIYEASAGIRSNDYMGELYVAVSPTNYNLLVLSELLVNNDVTSANGGLDTGRIGLVGNVKVIESNNLPAWVVTTNQLEALVFGKEAVGLLELVGLKTNQKEQIDFLDATLMTAYYDYGLDILRPSIACAIMSI